MTIDGIDSTPAVSQDEQEREITMKSSSIALRWLSPKKEMFLVPWSIEKNLGIFVCNKKGKRSE